MRADRTESFDKESSRDIFFDRLHKFSNEAFSGRMLGFSLSNAWVYLVFFNESSLMAPPSSDAVPTCIYQGSLAVLALTLFMCGGVFGSAFERLFAGPAAQMVPGAVCILGTSAIPFADLASPGGIACLALAAAGTGAGSGLLLLLWGKIYSLEGGPSAAAEVSISYVLAALLVPCYHAADPLLKTVLVTVLPVASSALLVSELRNVPAPAERTENEGGGEGTSGYASILLKFAISSIVFGCVVSVVRFLCTADASVPVSPHPIFAYPLSALFASCILLAILLFSRRLDLAFSYKPVLILMSFGCLTLPFLHDSPFLSFALSLSGYFCYEIVAWVMMSDMSFRFAVPPFRAYGFGRCAVSSGVLAGSLLTSWLAGNAELTIEFRFAASCFMMFAMAVTYTLTLTERDIARVHKRSMDRYRPSPHEGRSADGAMAGAPEGPDGSETGRAPLTLEDKVAIVADEHQISGRALEVMLLLAQGRTAARIEQELYISRGTVNTYCRRLYQKLDVHSRQELLDLIYQAGE